MYYYDPNGKSPRRWAAIAAAAYVLLIAASFALVAREGGYRAPRA